MSTATGTHPPVPSTATYVPTATGTPRVQHTPTTSLGSSSEGDPTALVTQALERQNAKAHRGTILGGQFPATFEYAPPDRYHVSSGATEVILLGTVDAFVKTQGRWSKSDSGLASLALLPILMACGFAERITAASLQGPETLNGKAMRVVSYQGQLKVEGATQPYSEPVLYRMWIGGDGLPYQVTFQVKSQPAGKTAIEYDPSIQIAAPSLP